MNESLVGFFDRKFVENMARQSVADIMLNGKIIGYRKVRVKKYLEFSIPWIEKHYHDDGDFEGYLLSSKRIYTKIVIGSEVVERAIRRKTPGQVIKFKRYAPLDSSRGVRKDLTQLDI